MESCRAWVLPWPGYNWSSGGQRCAETGLKGPQEQKSTWEASTPLQTRRVVVCFFSNRFVLEAGGTDVDWNDIFKTQNDIWSFPFGDLHLLRTLKVMISHLVFSSLQNSRGKREHFRDLIFDFQHSETLMRRSLTNLVMPLNSVTCFSNSQTTDTRSKCWTKP